MPSPSLPPGGKERRQQPPKPTALWWVLGVLTLLAIGQAYFLAPAGRQISYSEFKTLVRSGQVAEVAVGDSIIHGTLKKTENGATTFTTTRIEDPKLVEELDAASVKYSGEVVSRWLPEVLGWVVPILLLIAAWSFFFRRMGGAEGGVMSFARSKAKIYAEDDVKTTFQDVAGVDEAAQELREIVEFLKTPRKFTNLGGKIPKGVLLVGSAGHRQDAARARGGRRSQGAVLQPERIRIRRNVRRRGRGARPRSVLAGRSQGAVHRLHRRARRAGQGARAKPDWQPRRTRTDAQSAARGNGRLRRAQGDHHHGGHQPSRGARPCLDAARPLRSPGAGRQARCRRSRSGAEDPRAQREARPRDRSAQDGGAHGGICRRRSWPTS